MLDSLNRKIQLHYVAYSETEQKVNSQSICEYMKKMFSYKSYIEAITTFITRIN